jgi:predicted nucleotidyltransferase
MIKLTKKKIINTLEKNKDKLRVYSVKNIGLFGSHNSGVAKENSDIDLLVTFGSVSYDNYIELKMLLEKLLRRKVDLIIEKDLKPRLAYVKEEAEYARL